MSIKAHKFAFLSIYVINESINALSNLLEHFGNKTLIEHHTGCGHVLDNDIQWITPSEIPNYEFCQADEELLAKISEFF